MFCALSHQDNVIRVKHGPEPFFISSLGINLEPKALVELAQFRVVNGFNKVIEKDREQLR